MYPSRMVITGGLPFTFGALPVTASCWARRFFITSVSNVCVDIQLTPVLKNDSAQQINELRLDVVGTVDDGVVLIETSHVVVAHTDTVNLYTCTHCVILNLLDCLL